jgi:DNA-binding GntR family transcriptional regulator
MAFCERTPVSEPADVTFTATLSSNRTPDVVLGPIAQRTRPSSIAEVLRAAILDGTLKPGSQLREAHLASDLGVSRAPLREALSLLVDEGLVDKIPYRGAFVAEVSARAVVEIASLRRRLEPYAIQLARPKITGSARAAIERTIDDMADGADRDDLSATVFAHMRFHRAIYELSGHRLLLDLWCGWEAQLQLFFSADHRAFADLHDIAADHRRLLAVIDRGDPDEITGEIAVHVHSPSSADHDAQDRDCSGL